MSKNASEYLPSQDSSPVQAERDWLLERVIVKTALQNIGRELPPKIAACLAAAPEGWGSPEAGAIAAAIWAARANGQPPTIVTVSKHLRKDFTAALNELDEKADKQGLPLDLAEIEAGDLLEKIHSCRITATLGEAWQEAREHPEQTASIAEHVRETLAQLDGEAAPSVAEAVPIGELQRQEAGDEAELIRCRYLCRTCAFFSAARPASAKAPAAANPPLVWRLAARCFGLRPGPPAHVSANPSRE